MNKIIDFAVDHPVVDAIARNITLLCSETVPGMTSADVAKYAEDLAATFAKQVSVQREIMVSRLQIIHAYQQSVRSGREVTLDQKTLEFCADLGYEDWREHDIEGMRSNSREQLKSVRYEWLRAEIYKLVSQGELMIEITAGDCELALPQHFAGAQ